MACPLCVWWPAARASNPPFTLCPVGEDSTTLRTVQLNSFLRRVHGPFTHPWGWLPGAGWNWGRALLSQVASPSPVDHWQCYFGARSGFSKCKTASHKQVFYILRSPFLKVILQVIFVRMYIYHQFQKPQYQCQIIVAIILITDNDSQRDKKAEGLYDVGQVCQPDRLGANYCFKYFL